MKEERKNETIFKIKINKKKEWKRRKILGRTKNSRMKEKKISVERIKVTKNFGRNTKRENERKNQGENK